MLLPTAHLCVHIHQSIFPEKRHLQFPQCKCDPALIWEVALGFGQEETEGPHLNVVFLKEQPYIRVKVRCHTGREEDLSPCILNITVKLKIRPNTFKNLIFHERQDTQTMMLDSLMDDVQLLGRKGQIRCLI